MENNLPDYCPICTIFYVKALPQKAEPHLLQLFGKVKADPAVTLVGIGF